MMVHQLAGLSLILSGCLLSLTIALGLIHLNNFYCRLHVLVADLVFLVLLILFLSGVACYFWSWQALGICLAILIIHWLTSPLVTYLGKSPL